MAFSGKKDKHTVLILSEQESRDSGIELNKEYELVNAKKGIWLMVETGNAKETQPKPAEEKPVEKEEQKAKPKKSPREVELEAKIVEMIDSLPLGERVEGKFEEKLSEEEKPVFEAMIKESQVVAFRLSNKYKKAVYKLAAEKAGAAKDSGVKDAERTGAPEKKIEEYSLEKDGIMVIKNEQRAKSISARLSKEIKEGKIKGIRGFDGVFYVVEEELYKKYRELALKELRVKEKLALNDIAQKIGVSKTLARIVCEFLKDEGEIIEKSKETYQFIS